MDMIARSLSFRQMDYDAKEIVIYMFIKGDVLTAYLVFGQKN